ncbi:ABC transporter ATP-binding protein [Actinomycetaceae bacterium TAE3-ERU4]|nr:ABC transporter ATP-binding protein [Actinomycetaceae bacterium TAE3-ERU4]
MEEIIIKTRDLTKKFKTKAGPLVAVDHLNLEVPQGQSLGILGSNGAGKSTLLEMILGLTKPTSGEITVLGTDSVSAMRSGQVSALLQSGGLLPDMTVAETFEVISSLYDKRNQMEDIIEKTNLRPLLRKRIAHCSGGEIQRLRLAMALIPNSRVLVLDEPTAGMDPHAMREFWALVTDSVSAGTTLIFATHYMTEAERYGEKLMIMHAGKVLIEGSGAAIKEAEKANTLEDAFFAVTDRARHLQALTR